MLTRPNRTSYGRVRPVPWSKNADTGVQSDILSDRPVHDGQDGRTLRAGRDSVQIELRFAHGFNSSCDDPEVLWLASSHDGIHRHLFCRYHPPWLVQLPVCLMDCAPLPPGKRDEVKGRRMIGSPSVHPRSMYPSTTSFHVSNSSRAELNCPLVIARLSQRLRPIICSTGTMVKLKARALDGLRIYHLARMCYPCPKHWIPPV